MKKLILVPVVALLVCFSSCIISNPVPSDCVVIERTITKIREGSSHDITFYDNKGDLYYINRGLERGLILEDLNATVLNKTVTLHLPKLLGGTVTSEHIAQLAIGDNIIFTEFN